MNMRRYRYFSLSEFDSPDQKGSGENMDSSFLEMLDEARDCAGIPFKITSGYRTKEHNESLRNRGFKAVKTSAHLKGLAADISCKTSKERFIIIDALLFAGFTRIGIGKNFVHCDNDESKTPDLIFTYY
jgi:zinc D-Ala-D-Ala carboxypeptidase